jgi:hypothetical protein
MHVWQRRSRRPPGIAGLRVRSIQIGVSLGNHLRFRYTATTRDQPRIIIDVKSAMCMLAPRFHPFRGRSLPGSIPLERACRPLRRFPKCSIYFESQCC